MITKFKIYEAYSGAGKTIGFRYSSPKDNYKSVIVTDSIPSKELRKNLTVAVDSIEVDGSYEIEDEIITISFYSYSTNEADVIHKEFIEFIKSSGYEIVDNFLITPKELGIKRKPGFRISKEIPEKDPDIQTNKNSLGYGTSVQVPNKEQEQSYRPVGFKNYSEKQ